MKAIRVHAPGGPEALRYDEIERPAPGPGQALVKIEAAGVNFIDVYQRSGHYKLPVPFTLGQEAAGTVTAVGPGVAEPNVGERVAYTTVLGAYAEYAVVPYAAANLAPIPPGVTDEQAVMLCCVGTTGFGAVERSDLRFGDVVAIVGQGPVGMSATVAARLRGAASVIVVDGIAARRELAMRMGADVAFDVVDDVVEEVRRLTGGRLADVAIEAVGNQEAFTLALRLTRPGGTMSAVGNHGISDAALELPLDVGAFMGGIGDKRIVTTSAPGGKDRARRLLALVAGGKVDLGVYITHTFPLDEIEAALDLFRDKRDGVFKVAIKP